MAAPEQPATDAERKIVESLRTDGIVILENYYVRAWIDSITSQSRQAIGRLESGEDLGVKVMFESRDGSHRRNNEIEVLIPETKRFFDDPFIHRIVRCYAAHNVRSHHRMLDHRTGPGKMVGTDTFHFDEPNPKVKFKAFLYLVDVSETNGPFVYIPKTHKPGPWWWDKEKDTIIKQHTGAWGHYTPPEIDYIRKRFGVGERSAPRRPETLSSSTRPDCIDPA